MIASDGFTLNTCNTTLNKERCGFLLPCSAEIIMWSAYVLNPIVSK